MAAIVRAVDFGTEHWVDAGDARLLVPCGSRPTTPSNRLLLARSGGLVGRDLLADLLERAADQARDVHLRDPDLLGDLGLRQALEEAQVQDLPLALVEHPEAGREHRAVLRDLVSVLLGAERLERVELAVVVVPAGAGGERERAVRAAALER